MIYDLKSPAVQHDPYPTYAAMQNEPGIAQIASDLDGTVLFVTRYDDVAFVLKDPRFVNDARKLPNWDDWTKKWYIPPSMKSFVNSMALVDEPDHTRLRRLVHQAFTPRRVELLAASIEARTHALIDTMAGKRTLDFMDEFAIPLPLNIIADMMGVSQADRRSFRRWMSTSISTLDPKKPLEIPGKLWSALALDRMLKRLIADRRSTPQDDLTTALVQAEADGDNLSEDELIAMLFVILFAGHETTVNLLGTGILALLQQPDQLALLRSRPDLTESAIEELLRFTSPVQHVATRYTLEEVAIGGVTVPPYSTIMIGVAAANHDPAIFPDPRHLDITRSPNKHIAFGFGVHYCLGAPLARMEGQIALRALVERLPDLRLAAPVETLRWRGAPALRGLVTLPVHPHG